MSDDTAPVHSNDSVSERLAEIDQIADASKKVEALVELASQLLPSGSEVLEQALSAALAIQSESDRANALAAIAPQLPETERIKVLEQALSAALAIQDDRFGSRAKALAAIAPQLPTTEPQLLAQALSAAQSIQNEAYRAPVLAAIAPQLPETERLQVWQQVLSTVLAIQDKFDRARDLAAIASQLPETERLQVWQQALSDAHDIQNEYARATALAEIAPQLPETEPQLLQQALSAALDMKSEYARAKALAAIAPQLPISDRFKVLEQAIAVTKSIKAEPDQAKALTAIAKILLGFEPSILKQTLEIALQIKDKAARTTALQSISTQTFREIFLVTALSAVAKDFSETDTGFIVQLALKFTKENAVQVLHSLAQRFPEELVLQFPDSQLSLALNIVEKSLQEDIEKIRLLSTLAPRLSVGLFLVVLRLIKTSIKEDKYRVDALCNLASYIPEGQFPEAIRLIKELHIENQPEAFKGLIPQLSFANLHEILNILKKEEINKERVKIHTEILTQIAINLTSERLELTGENKYEGLVEKTFQKTTDLIDFLDKEVDQEPISILRSLSPVLTETQRDKILQDIQVNNLIVDDPQKIETLQAFAPFVSGSSQIFEACIGTLKKGFSQFSIRVRSPQWLSQEDNREEIHKFIDNFNNNDEERAVLSLYLAINSSTPTTGVPIAQAYLDALQKVRDIKDPEKKIENFQRLLSYLPDNQRLEAVDIARTIEDKDDSKKTQLLRSQALVSLACRFPEFRPEAFEAANSLQDLVEKVAQLSRLAVEVPERLLDIIKILEQAKVEEGSNWQENKAPDAATQTQGDDPKKLPKDRESFLPSESQKEVLTALSPHLPIRINREVKQENQFSSELWNRAIKILSRSYRDALQGGSLRNESTQDKDFLNLQDEVNALADLLLMRDLEPPMTVGILGGWGGGKSYIMHLMQTHMTEVRSRPVAATEAWNPDPKNEKLSPYVGHIYQIKFDAWTFAKSDLWASLMQTIFFELDRQLTLETQLTAVLNEIKDSGKRRDLESKIWAVLYKTSDVDRQWFLERVLTDKTLLDRLSQNNQAETTGQLWKTLNNSQQQAIEQLKKTQQQLEIARRDLDTQKAAIRKEINDQFAPLLKLNDLQNFKRVDALLGTSFILLRQRIGSQLFKHFQNQVHQKLYEDSGNSPKDGKPTGLWQELSQALEELEQARKKLALAEEASPERSSDQTAEQLKAEKEKVQKEIDTLFQKAEGLKLDIQTVASNVIEQQSCKVNWSSGWQWVKQNWLLLFLFLGFFISPLLLWKFFQINPIAIGTATVEQLLTRVAAILAPTLPTLVTLQSLLRSSQKWFEETQLALHEYEKSVENRNKQVEITIETTIQERLQKNDALQQLERNVRHLETQVEQQKHALPVNEYASLNDFVSDRLSSKTYANRLGLMQQVKEDLFDLSNKLLPPNGQSLESKIDFLRDTFPRGPARVVVYIDDLDRCPPDRVVQVLEAVQLLVKTPLFIAVLAVDERYITRALEKFYEGVLSRRGRPSGTDYLEKIIQLPYRVRPIMANTLESYLRSQVVIQDSATGGAKFSEFSRQEFNLLLACCQQVDLSPRTLKRLTNVYKLFKIVCRTRGTKPSLQVQQSILALLALSGRYPDLMRGIFDSIETCFEEQRTLEKAEKTLQPLHLKSPLRDFFKKYQLTEGDRYLQREFDKLQHDALRTNILPTALTLIDMTHEIFNLIRSFSFVGEIGEDPEDYRISESTMMTDQ